MLTVINQVLAVGSWLFQGLLFGHPGLADADRNVAFLNCLC